MRINNLKTHLVAITLICLVIIGLYFLLGGDKTPKGPQPLQGDRYIQIDSATWGKNCDPYVDEALKKIPTVDLSKPISTRPHHAAINNALLAISTACNGHLRCNFEPTTALIGDEPLANCFKHLEIRYRCFAYDHLVSLDVGQHDNVLIDCAEKSVPTPKYNPSMATPH